jgi:hypothetical protein
MPGTNRAEKQQANRKARFFQKASLILLSKPDYAAQCFSRSPQAVAKIAGFGRGSGVKRMLFYVGRVNHDKPELELEDGFGGRIIGRENIEKIYESWKQSFDKRRGSAPARHATHIVLSASSENNPKNLQKVLSAARVTAQNRFGAKGYDFVLGLHQDGSHPHVHAIVRNNHNSCGRKFKLNPPDLQKIRRDFAKELSLLGLEHSATYKIHRIKNTEKIKTQATQTGIRINRNITAAKKNILESDISIHEKEKALESLKEYSKAADKTLKKRINKKNISEIKKNLKIIQKKIKTASRNILPEKEPAEDKKQVRAKKIKQFGITPPEPPENKNTAFKRLRDSMKRLNSEKGGLNAEAENKLVAEIKTNIKFLKKNLPEAVEGKELTVSEKGFLRRVQRYERLFARIKTEISDKDLLPPDKETLKKLKPHFRKEDLKKIKKQRDAEILLKTVSVPAKQNKTGRIEKTLKKRKSLDISR